MNFILLPVENSMNSCSQVVRRKILQAKQLPNIFDILSHCLLGQ